MSESGCFGNDCQTEEEFEEDFEGEQEKKDDYTKGGYHLVRIGDLYENRYRVIRKLGWGTFSTVWLCFDNKHNQYVAIKVVKSKPSLQKSVLEEIDMLCVVQNADPNDPFSQRVVSLLDHFTIEGENGKHKCIVFEVLGQSLLKLMSRFENGIPIEILKPIVRQILEALDYLHKKSKLIHTDIKPENILLTVNKTQIQRMHSEVEHLIRCGGERQLPHSFVSSFLIEGKQRSQTCLSINEQNIENFSNFNQNFNETKDLKELSIKVIDLGNAIPISNSNRLYLSKIQTRPYRSPEVIIDSGFDCSADIWSTACTIFELATGDILFNPKNTNKISRNAVHLAKISELLGPFPKYCRKGKNYNKYFTKSGRLLKLKIINKTTLDKLLIINYNWEPTLAQSFAQFLLPMLNIDQTKRPTANQCLSHEWLST